MTKPDKPATPDHAATPATPATPEHHEPRPDPDKREPLAIVDFDLIIVRTGPLPTKRTAQKRSDALAHLTCTACGDTADSRDRAMVMRAAHIHARTAHDGARARVRSADNPTT